MEFEVTEKNRDGDCPQSRRGLSPRGGWIAAVMTVIFFIAYAWFPLQSPKLYNSPDDQANAFFITRFVEHGELWFHEPLNLEVDGRVVQRSMRAIGERVVPIGFPGQAILYGVLAKLTGLGAMNLFTPLLVALSVALLYLAMKKKYDPWTALIAAIAYGAHPALWYYTSRGLYPNAAVMALIVIAFSSIFIGTGSRIKSGISAILIALAIFIRPIELVWIVPVLFFFVMLSKAKHQGVRDPSPLLRMTTGGVLLGIGAALLANHWVYGEWLATGYSASLAAPDALGAAAFSFRAVAARMVKFGVLVFPFQSALAIIAWLWLMTKKEFRKGALCTAACGLLIVVPYAIFGARDLVGTGIPTIGTSFMRYWLPAFLIGAATMVFAATKIKTRKITMLMMAMYIATSAYAVWFGTPDSLSQVTQSLWRYQGIQATAEKLIEPDAIIICEQADKIFFPKYRVVAWLRNPGTYEAIPKLLNEAPVYYYGITFPPADIETLYREKLPKGVKIEAMQTFDNETLYKLTEK